jgi:hypothetical protein
MRLRTAIVLLVITTTAQSVLAQDIAGLQTSLDNVANKLAALTVVLQTTNTNLTGITSALNTAVTTINQNMPQMQDSLSRAANGIQTVGNATTTVQNNVTPIVFAIVGALAAGIVLGLSLKSTVFTLDPKANIFCVGYNSLRECWRPAAVEPPL